MASRVPTWVWVVIGIVVVCAIALVGVAVTGIYFVARQVDTVEASPATADQTFERERVRFKDRTVSSSSTATTTSPRPTSTIRRRPARHGSSSL